MPQLLNSTAGAREVDVAPIAIVPRHNVLVKPPPRVNILHSLQARQLRVRQRLMELFLHPNPLHRALEHWQDARRRLAEFLLNFGPLARAYGE